MNKINGQKLLPSSDKLSVSKKKLSSSQLVPYKNIKESKVTASKDKPKEKKETLLGNVINIKKTVIKIERLISARNTSLLKEQNNIRKENENKKRTEKEKDLETKKESKSLKIPTPNIPKIGIVDYIKNFLKWVIIGRAFILFSKHIPNILSFIKKLKPLYDFFKTLSGALFNGIVTFIEWSDKAQKKLREIVGSLGGEPFQKAFDDFSGALTTFTNLALIAGMATMGGSDLGVGDALDDISPDTKKPTRKKPKVTTSGGRTPGRPNIRNPLRQRPQITTSGSGTGRPRVTTSGGRTARTPKPRSSAPRVTGSGVNQGGKLAAKSLLRSVRPLLRGMIIGGLIDFGLSVALGENPGRAAFGAIGGTLLGTIGGVLGGPFAPFTAIGGGLLGDWAGRKLYDAFFTGKKPSNTKPQKKNQGGYIKPKTGKSTSSTRKTPRQGARSLIKPPIRKTQPGKDVGGEKQIKRLYPDSDQKMTLDEFLRSPMGQGTYNYTMYENDFKKRSRKPNSYRALIKISETLKSAPFVGRILGAPIDVALGQKPDKLAFKSFSEGISFIASALATNEINQSMSIIKNNIKAFREGGEIPTRELSSIKPKNNFENVIETILGKDIEKSFNKSLDIIKKEVDKIGKPGSTKPPSPGNLDDTYDYEVTGGEVPSKYQGRYLDHGYKGRDYEIEVGRAVTVFAPGVVTYAQYNSGGFGRLVIVKHSNGQESYYAHLSKINVRVGESISDNGTVIGLTGGDTKDPGSGRTTGPHLHFELRDSKGNRITEENSGDNFFRFGKVKSAKPRVGTLRPGEAGKPGQKFSIAQLVTLAKKAGFKGNNVAIAAAIAMAESGGKSGELNDNPKTGDLSYGLWQINMIGNLGPDRRKKFRLKSNEDLFDPAINANVAYKISGGSDFSSWTTYRDGLHLPFLPAAEKASQKGDVVLPGQPKVPNLKPPTIPEMGGQQIEQNYGMNLHDEFEFTGPDGKKYKAHKTAKGFDFYTVGPFSQKINTTGGKNQKIVDAFIRERQKYLNKKSSSSGTKVSIYSGHADMTKKSGGEIGTMGGISKLINSNFLSNEAFLNDLIARRVADKASGLAIYRSPIKTDADRDPNSNWERARKDVSSGIVPFEMHHDQPSGSAGLLMGANYNSRLKNPFIKSLHNLYGRHAGDQEKGFFKYGGAIVEISNLTPAILKDQKSINAHVEKESSKIANSIINAKKQGGGYIDKNVNRLGMISNYSDDEMESTIYIQPVYIERIVPIPGKENFMNFPGNSTALNSTSAGSRNLTR